MSSCESSYSSSSALLLLDFLSSSLFTRVLLGSLLYTSPSLPSPPPPPPNCRLSSVQTQPLATSPFPSLSLHHCPFFAPLSLSVSLFTAVPSLASLTCLKYLYFFTLFTFSDCILHFLSKLLSCSCFFIMPFLFLSGSRFPCNQYFCRLYSSLSYHCKKFINYDIITISIFIIVSVMIH